MLYEIPYMIAIMDRTCAKTGQQFTIPPEEMALRKKLGVEGEPNLHPIYRFMQLGAFWQQWNLHKRTCGYTGKPIVSVFSAECPYPVWHKDEWIKHADPPCAAFNTSQEVFPQMWDLFQQCPIPHNVGTDNQNCEYTDDWWHSKNCYLSHSGLACEDCQYIYRTIRLKNCQFCVFSFDCELCVDAIHCYECFQVRYAFLSRSCTDSAFLFDCRNCSNCFFCSNLRNKQYCFENQQCTKEEYEQKVRDWDIRSRSVYARAIQKFDEMLRDDAWFRALYNEQCQNVMGNYLDRCKDCRNCYFLGDAETCANVWRGAENCKDILDSISPAFRCELLYNASLVQDHCYDIQYCTEISQSKWMRYCAHCLQCKHCFGCCGLVGKEYCIFNKQYSKEEYEKLRGEIIEHMKQTGEWGRFFPGYFAAHPYEESLAGFYWPLSEEQLKEYGFRSAPRTAQRPSGVRDANEIPGHSDGVDPAIASWTFWDEEEQRPFRIREDDISFAQERGVPISNTYYIRHIKDNFRRIPFSGSLRTVTCAQCSSQTETSWSEEYDGRILCEECYLKEVY